MLGDGVGYIGLVGGFQGTTSDELDAAIADVGDSVLTGSSTMEWEYLLLTARTVG